MCFGPLWFAISAAPPSASRSCAATPQGSCGRGLKCCAHRPRQLSPARPSLRALGEPLSDRILPYPETTKIENKNQHCWLTGNEKIGKEAPQKQPGEQLARWLSPLT